MKKIYLLASLAFTVNAFAQGVGISSSSITPDASAILELRSTTQGLLFPRTTTGSIASPAQGLMIFNTATSQFNYFDGTAWQALLGGGNGITSLNGLTGATQTFANGTNVTITSVGTTHTFGWTGQLSVANGGTGLALGTSGGILGYTAAGTIASSGLLTQNALLIGGGAGATPTALGSLGTTTSLLHGNAAGAPTYGAVVLTTDVSGILPVANGGTGSSVQNYVDLTTAQTVAGAKTWSNLGTFNAGITSIGAAVNLNASSNFATNINTGTSTGGVTIGGTGAQAISIGNGAAVQTVNLGSSNTTSSTSLLSGSGAINLNTSNNQPTNINTGTSTGLVTVGGTGAQTISIGNGAAAKTVNLGSLTGASATTLLSGTGAINLNASNNQPTNINTGTSTGLVTVGGTGAQTISIGNGAAVKTVNLGSSNTTSSTTLLSGSGAINLNASNNQPTNINTGTSTGAVAIGGTAAQTIDIGGAASTTTIGSIKNTIGIAGVANGDGVRIGNGRITVNKPTAPTTGLNASTTLTVAEVLDAGIIGCAAGFIGITITLPTAKTATGLVQALPGTPAVGDVFTFLVYNTGTGAVTIAAGAGGTVVNTSTIAAGTSRVIHCRVTSVTANAETISIY